MDFYHFTRSFFSPPLSDYACLMGLMSFHALFSLSGSTELRVFYWLSHFHAYFSLSGSAKLRVFYNLDAISRVVCSTRQYRATRVSWIFIISRVNYPLEFYRRNTPLHSMGFRSSRRTSKLCPNMFYGLKPGAQYGQMKTVPKPWRIRGESGQNMHVNVRLTRCSYFVHENL